MSNLPENPAAGAALLEDCAAEFIARQTEGELVERAEFHARLANGAERARFDELVAGATSARRVLPRLPVLGGLFLERYEIVRVLGEGGEGRVYLARDRDLHREVAIKVRSALGRAEAENQQRLLKESRLLAALRHPNIVAVHDWGLDGDLAYLVMDYVDGEPLDAVLATLRARAQQTSSGRITLSADAWSQAIARPLAPGHVSLIDERDTYATAARIALELARTIEAAHGQGVFHRDLKPANVLLTGGGHPVVLDFGLAGRADLAPGDVTRGFFGSAPYLAPEQVRDERVGCSASTDVYQLGLLLYELLTLQRAFQSPATGQVLDAIKLGAFAPPTRVNPGVPRALEAICMYALELEPAQRYASVRALREDLEAYLSGTSVPVALQSDRTRALFRGVRAANKRHPSLLGVAIAVVVALSALVAWKFAPRVHASAANMLQPIRAWPIDREHNATAVLRPSDAVLPDEGLGVRVRAEHGFELYVFSVFENAAGERLAVPVNMVALADYHPLDTPEEAAARRLESRDSGRFGLAVPACTDPSGQECPVIVCAKAERENTAEGLLVVASERPLAEVEAWMHELHARGGVPLAVVQAEFPDLSVERGSSARDARIDAAALAELRARLGNAESNPGVEQRFAGMPALYVMYPVEQR